MDMTALFIIIAVVVGFIAGAAFAVYAAITLNDSTPSDPWEGW